MSGGLHLVVSAAGIVFGMMVSPNWGNRGPPLAVIGYALYAYPWTTMMI